MSNSEESQDELPHTADNKDNLTCRWCRVKFRNRGNLVSHAYHMHGDTSYQQTRSDNIRCKICNVYFGQPYQLKYHTRRIHYNLIAKQPYCELKKVNQVWFEKVLNSNVIVEIKKPEQNMLLIRKLHENTSIKVNENVTETVDLNYLYPTGRGQLSVECKICHKRYSPLTIKKHVEETHYNKVKHRCNNCNLTFKRLYHYLKHNCHKSRKRIRGVKTPQHHEGMKICSVESLSVPKL